MECGNHTVTEFILLGLSNNSSLQVQLVMFIFITYLCTLTANLLLILTVRTDHRLHNAMYFFLANLSFLDICYTSIIVPKMFVNFINLKKSISISGCIVQIYFYLFVGDSESIFLAWMAYDRFVAICYPLRYNMIMSKMVCVKMITASWMTGFVISSVDVFLLSRLTYSGPNTINHFFCHVRLLVHLSCNYSSLEVILNIISVIILLILPIFLIILSYICILVAVMRIRSGRYKAFSKCMSHLIVVILYYGTAIVMYTSLSDSVKSKDKILSVFYTNVIPLLNPLIYSLRNQDVKRGMRKLFI